MSNKVRLKKEKEWFGCTKCVLCEERNTTVVGYGELNADIMLIGEGPGEDEDMSGIPFVGKSGGILNMFLNHLGVDRDEVFINNLVSCRPPDNRNPKKEEIIACMPRLKTSIYLVDPIIIIALGALPTKYLTNTSKNITEARGNLLTTTVNRKQLPLPKSKHPPIDVKYPVMPTYHPSFIYRNRSIKDKPDSCWEQFHSDLKLTLEIYDKLQKVHRDIDEPERDFR
jgi:uracil-DNA glycosylase family 4